ncbi:Cof-type HAD-IIB family hydrolase [Gottschalkiaceae bacterium SANA]|nr:Cof-type HAD-IIB family hydrolase [Gottschalkiaceae bacterium SANA]
MSKYIFLDLDGTLLNNDKSIPDSARKAIHLAKENGHKLVVATGRSNKGVIPSIRELNFDGYIFSAGAVVEINKKTIRKQEMDPNMVVDLIHAMEENHIGFILEGYHHSYYNQTFTQHIDINELIKNRNLDERVFRPVIEYQQVSSKVYKIAFFAHDLEQAQQFELKLENCSGVTAFTHKKVEGDLINGEITVSGVTKASGIEMMMSHLAEPMEKTISFGDSLNDLEMLELTHTGICMGNGVDQLKKIADDVTDTPANDGLYKAFIKHNLI